MTIAHLDDEALSAAMDGAATTSEEAHLASCAECSARMVKLVAVARAVAIPVSARPVAEVDDAIAHAMTAWPAAGGGSLALPAETEGGGSPPEGAGSPPEGAGSPPEGAGSAASLAGLQAGASLGERSRLRSRRRGGPNRWLGPAAGIAAALLVVGGLVAVFRAVSGPGSRSTVASSASGTTSVLPSKGLARGPDAVPSGGNLGDQSDPTALARQVAASLFRTATAAPAAPAPAAGPSTPLFAPTHAVCEVEARAVLGFPDGDGATVAYTATVRWRGQPAVAVVLSHPGGLAGLVMSVPGCSVLARLPF